MIFFKKILKYAVWFIGVIVILIISLYFFIQTETFNKWALNFALNELNDSESWIIKDNSINVESINGNILKGLRVNNVIVTVQKDTLVSIKYIDLKYDIWGLLKQTISLDYVILNSPVVNLTKTKGGLDSLVWNFTNLFTPSADTTSSPFNWDIYVNSLRIENGKFKILGDIPSKPLWALQWEKQSEFKFNELDISDFQLDMTGEYSKNFKKINLRNLSFRSNTDFTINKLAFDAFINIKDTLTDISNFELLTDRSDIKISRLSAYSLNLLSNDAFNNIENTKISFILNVDKFNFADLRYFIPGVDMLDSTVSLYLNANGTYNNLDISSLTLKLPNSIINLKGNIKNLSNPDSMYLDITTSGKINTIDINKVLKIKSIPDFRRLGIVQTDIYYKGSIYDFYSEFDIRTSGGNIQGLGHLNIDKEQYRGNVTSSNLNLASVLNDNKLKSNINISAIFEGSGYTPKTMSTRVRYKSGNSSIAGYSISSSSGTLNINRNNISMNIKANSSAGNAVVSGKINISNMKNPVYSFKGKMNNVDVSRFSGDNNDKSNLNADFDINGSGITMNNLAGTFNVDVGNSFYSQYEIPSTNIIAKLNMSSESSSVLISNDAMELKTDGTFSLSALIDAVLYNISMVSNIAEKKMYPDSSFTYTNLSSYNHTGNVNFNYQFVTKDSSELRKLSAPFGIIFNGDVNGSLSNSTNGFNTKSVVLIKNFVYNDTLILLNNFKGNIAFTNDYMNISDEDLLSSIRINMDANADKIVFNKTVIDSMKTELTLSESIANLDIGGKMDSLKYARMKSNIDIRDNEIIFKFDSIYARYNDYTIVNNKSWKVSYIPNREININQLGLKTGNMVFNVDGIYSLTGSSNININGDNINFGQIYEMLRPFDTTATGEKNVYPVQGELKKLNVNIQGTPEDATLSLKVLTNTMTFDTIGIGTISGNVSYKDQILSPDIIITNNGDKGVLKITGNVPFENPIIQKDTSAIPPDKPAELHILANNFEIQYFTKLIPGIGDLRGILNGSLNADGTFQNPNLKGELTMVQGKYFMHFTGMYYDYKFKISTDNSKLLIDYIRIYNPSDDTKHIDLSGDVDFKGYKLNDINLTTSGEMVLLDKNNQENELGIKGYLLGGIGNPPITINGNMEKLNVKGQFLIKEATISSMPSSVKGYQKDEKNIVYLSANDSAFVSDTNRRKINLAEYEIINPFLRNRYILIDTSKSFSVMDMLALDVAVKTERNLNISIDFDNLTRDRLFGEVIADLRLRTRRGRLIANGEALVVGNSYYRFYRDFKVKESKIVFRGPIDKPVLDIRAVYANTKSTEQFGTITSSPIQVVLTVTGEPNNPEITLRLYENGTEMQGNDATSDAITFLLFGKYKNELSTSESQSVATGIGSTVGSLYVTSFFGQIVRNVLPFIKDAEINYTEGSIHNTNVNVSSDLFGANFTVGSRVINDIAYLEFNVEYPLNNIMKINLPEKVILQFAREQLSSSVISNMDVKYSTGMKVLYRFKF